MEPSNRISTKVRQEAKTINDPKILVDSSRETPIRVFPGAYVDLLCCVCCVYKWIASGKENCILTIVILFNIHNIHTHIYVFPGSAHALADINRLRQEGHDIQAAVASRTDEPHWAKICMDNLIVDDGTTLSQCFGNLVEIYYGDKTHHFRKLKEKTGIPYECMGE